MRQPIVLLLCLAVCAAPAAAQQASGDSGQVILDTHLGGDSAQAAQVGLRRGATYRLEFRPAGAQLLIRQRTRDGAAAPPLDTLTRSPLDTVPAGWRAVRIQPTANGAHVIELTNPQVGPTSVRLVVVHRSPTDTAGHAISHLVANENVSGTIPVFLALDSGHIYRIVPVQNAPIYMSPRSISRPPIRFVLIGGPSRGVIGIPFVADFTGDYRFETDPGSEASFQLYEVEGDSAMAACVRRTRGAGCLGNPSTPHSHFAPIVIAISLPVIFLINAISR